MNASETPKCADLIDENWKERAQNIAGMLTSLESDDDETREEASDGLMNFAYGVTKNTIYTLTWSGGGPADYLEVEVDELGEVVAARYRYQDWFDGAVKELTGSDLETARTYATYVLALDC